VKPHIELKYRPETPLPDAPYWETIIRDKSEAVTETHRDVARVLARYALPVWVTQAYAPAGSTWSPAEIASGLNRIYRLVLQEKRTIPPRLIHEISVLPVVEYARVGRIGSAELPEPLPAQMSATTDMRSRRAIMLEEAQQLTRGDPEVTIAILDTGIDLTHPELRGTLLRGRDFVDILDGADQFLGDYLDADEDPTDEVGHGTHVAGIVAGRGDAMPPGVVPRCRLLPVRVLGALRQGERRVGAGLVDNINVGIKWAVDQGADVISMSLGVRHTGGGLPHQEVVEYARRRGVTMVAAAGNDGTDQLYYPGALPYVIAVGAEDEDGQVAPYSTWGAVTFIAPGTNIYSTYVNRDYAFSTGTSHATPFVSGAVAMLKSFARQRGQPRLGDGKVKHVLKHTADKVDRAFRTKKAGFGRVNLYDALRLLDYKLAHTSN
jgi:subtilisin family serine protease